MKILLTTACLFVVTTVGVVTFIAPTVFGQENEKTKVNPSPAKSTAQEVLDPERKALYEKWMRFHEPPKDILLTPAFADAFETLVGGERMIVRFTRNQQNAVSGFMRTTESWVRRLRFNKQ